MFIQLSKITIASRMQSPTTAQFGSRLPKQIQRALPVYIAILLLILFFSNADSVVHVADVVKRDSFRQSTLPTSIRFPRKVWQTWKVHPFGFEQRDFTCAKSWTEKNPAYRYEVLTDDNDLYYVETHFGPDGFNRPDIVEVYRSLTARIVKADLLRYLVMYVEGGLYADIDVEALKPIDRFIPERYKEGDIDMVIGVEIDQPEFVDHPILGPKSRSFCQWTFMCKPRLPVMLKLIENIINWLNEIAEKQNVPISDIVLDFDDVISGTGPSAFTIAVLEQMTVKHGQVVDWDYFHNMVESKLVGGVLVLTVEAFAAGQGHSDSGTHNSRTALVKHHYHASQWPVNHPRFNHPVFGEVERCNWEPDCVRLWDTNKAAFDALIAEDQANQIAMKQAADKAAEDQKAIHQAFQQAVVPDVAPGVPPVI